MTSPHAELIARLEKCVEPDRELSDAVLFACGWRVNYSWDVLAQEQEEIGGYPEDLLDNACWYPPGVKLDWIYGFKRPDPLASIDAALTLIPDGLFWVLAKGRIRPEEPLAGFSIVRPDDMNNPIAEAEGNSLALCIVICALKSREAA